MGTKNAETVGYRKAGIALTAALSCFLIYVLACVWSAPSWSPDSSGIAFLFMSGEADEPEQFAIFAYDLRTDQHVLLDRADANGLLASPSWSPDGKWIAYYRMRPPAPEAEAPAPTDAAGSEPNQTAGAGQAAKQPAGAAEMFSEENRMLPPFMFDAFDEQIEDERDGMLPMELVVVTPDGKERKTVQTFQCPDLDDDWAMFALLRPEWSKDSKRLFYARIVANDPFYYVSSLDLATGAAQAHLFSTNGAFALSPDGDWLVSCLGLDDDSKQVVLCVAKTDGSEQRYFRLDAEEADRDEMSFFTTQPSWSPDSKYVLVPRKELCVVNVSTGQMRKYRDPQTDQITYARFSPRGEGLYYLAARKPTDPNGGEEHAILKSCDRKSGRTRTVLDFSQTPGCAGGGQFSISPNGKVFSLWCGLQTADAEEPEIGLLLWDGKTRKVIKPNSWLPKPAASASGNPAEPGGSQR
jgi:hypothetical protein